MARRLDFSIDKHRVIFRDSVTEDNFSGIDVEESDEEWSGEVRNKIATEDAAETNDEEEEWTADLTHMRVGQFTAQAITVLDVGVNPKVDNFFHL